MMLRLVYLLLLLIPALAQQGPTYRTPLLDYSVSHRQSVCDRQQLLHNGNITLREALQGMELRPLLGFGNISSLQLQTEFIPETNPGLIVELLDEIGRRAEFTWRDSFGIVDYTDRSKGSNFDDLLDWSVRTYDIAAAQWARTLSRINRGISFPDGWYDGSVIMVGIQDTSSSSLNVWSFLEPFTAGVWVMIGVTILISGLIYWWMEWFNEDSDRQELGNKPTETIFFAALAFTGEPNFQPSTDFARIFVISLAFWCLLTSSAYTANLASFLVTQNTPSLRVESVGDAVKAGLSMCVFAGTMPDISVSEAHPGAKLVRKDIEDDVFLGVADGECDLAITSVGSWDRYRGRSLVNANCNLAWVGRIFRFSEGGFATRGDSGTLCTNLVRDAFNLHLLEMEQEGFIEKAWERELERTSDIDCDASGSSDNTENDDSSQLGLQDMGGLFIIHYGLSVLAILMALYTKRNNQGKLRRMASGLGMHHRTTKEHAEKTDEDNPLDQLSVDNGMPVTGSSHRLTQSQFDSLYKQQSEQLAILSDQMKDMVTKLNTVRNDSEVMRSMIETSATKDA